VGLSELSNRSAFKSGVSAARVVASLVYVPAALATFACSDSSGPKVGPLASLVVRPPTPPSAMAGTVVATPIVIVPTDAQGRTIPNESAVFSVTAGGGTIANTTGQRNADGTITAPAWTLGKSAVPQTLGVTIEGKSATVNATVTTSYSIDVRFFGAPLSPSNQALFTDAAARLLGAVVGLVPPISGSDVDPSQCGVTGQGPPTGTIRGVLIYASIDSIDGPRAVLASSGPCYVRTDNGGGTDFRTAVGVMKFDSADLALLAGSGNLQEVITHEMLHVLGFGSFWGSTDKNLVVNPSTANAAYTGASGIAGCKAIGGNITCASSVPVEGTQGGDGTVNSHWRESTFGKELMTGFLNSGINPLSVMTIRSLEDLGYTVNPAAADAFTIPGGSIRASGDAGTSASIMAGTDWERPLRIKPKRLPTTGLPPNILGN